MGATERDRDPLAAAIVDDIVAALTSGKAEEGPGQPNKIHIDRVAIGTPAAQAR